MTEKNIKLKDLKRDAYSKDVITEMNKYYSSKTVERYVENVRTVEDTNLIIGYGSLMNKADALRTMPDLLFHHIGHVDEYERIFNFGNTHRGSWLNVQRSSHSNMPVAVIGVNPEDMIKFYQREILYDVVNTRVKIDGPTSSLAKMVMVTDSAKLNPFIEPMLSYANLCTQGMKEIGNSNDMDKFLKYTKTASGESLEDWYNSLNVLDYIKSHEHQSR